MIGNEVSTLILSISAFILLFLMYMLIRNQFVLNFRIRMLDSESDYLDKRIMSGEAHISFKRYDSLPSYDYMLLHFWRRLKSWERPLEEYYPERRL